MKFIKRLFKFILVLGLGFLMGLYFANGNNLTRLISEINQIVDVIDNDNHIDDVDNSENNTQPKIRPLDIFQSRPDTIDYELIEAKILELLNELRIEQGLNPVVRNQVLTDAANIRAIETETSFSHTRPNGTDPFTVLNEDGTVYNYLLAGENLAMATYLRSDEHMSEIIFQGWVESEDHYNTMINPDFVEVGVGVHYDGEILYATQIFGTPYY